MLPSSSLLSYSLLEFGLVGVALVLLAGVWAGRCCLVLSSLEVGPVAVAGVLRAGVGARPPRTLMHDIRYMYELSGWDASFIVAATAVEAAAPCHMHG